MQGIVLDHYHYSSSSLDHNCPVDFEFVIKHYSSLSLEYTRPVVIFLSRLFLLSSASFSGSTIQPTQKILARSSVRPYWSNLWGPRFFHVSHLITLCASTRVGRFSSTRVGRSQRKLLLNASSSHLSAEMILRLCVWQGVEG